MPHIDEGALHAYLDGALDEFPASEAERVRAHLEQCGACRERLDVERAVRDQAAAILSVASPHVVAPSFEELRASQRVRATGRQTSSHRLSRLGWAASLLLAVGVGWALRGGSTPADGFDAVAPEAGVVAASDGGVVVADAAAPDQPDLPAASTEQAGPASGSGDAGPSLLPSRTQLGPVSVEVASFDDIDAAGFDRDLDVEAPPLPQAPAIEPTVAEAVVLVADGDLAPVDASSDEARAAERERPRSPSEVVTLGSLSADAPGIGTLGRGSDVEPDGIDDLEDDEAPYSLVVPGLEVIDVRFRGGVTPEGQVVRQRLASGETLEVIHLPVDVDPSTLEEAAPQDRELVLETGSGWIVMRAPVDRDELMELMTRLLGRD